MPSLSQLLSQPALGLKLVQSGAGDPEISWVSTTELVDLSEYLDGGELVLTTGVSLSAHDPRWRDFVADLSRARVAAIGFGIGVVHERIPDLLRSAASTYRVALIEVPPPTPFIAISKAVSSLLNVDELRAAHEALLAQQRILDHAFGETGPAGVISAVAAATGRQVAVLSRADTVIAGTAGFPTHADGASGEAVPASATGADMPPRVSPREPEITSLDIGAGRRLAVAGGPLGPEARAALTAGAIVMSVENRGQERYGEREAQRWSRLTQALLDGDPHARGLLQLLDPTVSVPPLLRVIAIQGSPDAISAWRAEPRGGIARLVALPSEPSPGVARAWQIITDGSPTDHALETAASHGLDAVVGIAAPLEASLSSLRSLEPHLPVLSAVEQLYQQPRSPRVIFADRDSAVLGALLRPPSPVGAVGAGGVTDAPARAVVGEVLGPLQASANAYSSDGGHPNLGADERTVLRSTLRSFLAHQGNRGACADHLGVHRNTVRTRLARIEALLDRSLGDPDDRAELWIAFRLEDRLATEPTAGTDRQGVGTQ
ncbi:PucR family transcriptional regulator [Leucobacter sp. W1153]|uniref:PucR family transcriptional regulator n=1 Tax=Leucobacter sp. W1153 TaxID=3439064 RepID=UPI003F2C512D